MFVLDSLEGTRQTPAKMALRFCLSYPGVSTAIPGMLSQTEAEENVLASDLGSFSQEELAILEAVYERMIFSYPDLEG